MYTRFEIEPDYADALRAAGLADFDALMNAPAGPPTSKHRHRETVPIEFDVNGKRQRFFLKRVFKVPGQHGWRPWLRGKPGYSQPVREWDNIRMMRDAGIPVMKRVAVGERRKFGIPKQAFILVEDVGMQWTLENWLIPGFPKPPGAEKIDTRQLWFELGKLQRLFGHAKIDWPDIHAKHIFAEPTPTNSDHPSWRIEFIDVERASHVPREADYAWCQPASAGTGLPSVRCPSNIRLRICRNAWAPLWQSLAVCRFDEGDAESFYYGLTGKSASQKRDWTLQRTPWLFRHMPVVLPDSNVHVRAECVQWQAGIKSTERDRTLLARIGIDDVPSAFALNDAQDLRKPGLQPHRDRLRIVTRDENGHDIVLYVKRYRRPPLREQIRRMMEAERTHSSAYREYQWSRRLMEVGIPCVRAFAVGEEMNGWWEQRSFGVATAVDGESLESIARNWNLRPDTRPSLNDRWELIERAAHLVGRLHNRHFYHRDLYLSHIFLSRNSAGRPVLQLIDLARMLQKSQFDAWQRWEIKDLAALAYSVSPGLLTRTDHLRFLRARGFKYFLRKSGEPRNSGHAGTDRSELLAVISKIERRVAKMARHDAKRAARLAGQNAPR